MDSPQASSVRHLESLYSVVIGLGLSLGMFNLIDASRTPIPIKPNLLLFFLSYLATLIPFYHGALRHLDARYIDIGSANPQSLALLGDFLVLFFESCIFFALALLLPSPGYYTLALVALLVVDAIWGFISRVAFPSAKPESHWAYVNVITAVVLVVVLALMHGFPLIPGASSPALAVVVFAISLGRTVIDYRWTWDFYFPPA
jgi:hypothetical protein